MPPPIALLPLLITSGLIAFMLRWRRVRSSPARMSLAAEVALMTLVLFGLFCGLVVVAQRLPW